MQDKQPYRVSRFRRTRRMEEPPPTEPPWQDGVPWRWGIRWKITTWGFQAWARIVTVCLLRGAEVGYHVERVTIETRNDAR